MRWASAISRYDDTLDALDEVVESVRTQLRGSRPDLLVLFASPHHASHWRDLPHLLEIAFPGTLLIGCSGEGVIGAGDEVEDEAGLSLTAARLPDVELRPFHLEASELPAGDDTESWAGAIGIEEDSHPHFVLVGDPFTADPERLLAGLDKAFPHATKIGGMASGSGAIGGHALFLGEATFHTGVVGVALTGNVEVDTVVARGCRPIGHPRIVTRCDENLLLELDGEGALEVLRELYRDLSPTDKLLLRSGLFIGLEMRDTVEHQEGDFLIRDVGGIDKERGGIWVGEDIHRFQVVQFHLRDAESSARDIDSVLARFRGRASGALLFTCVGRGAALYGHRNHDSDSFRRHFGDVPLGGFFGNGEIGPVEGTTFLHGFTSAFGLFRPRQPS